MKKSNQTDKKILESIDWKIRYVYNLINDDTMPGLIFVNKILYYEVIVVSKEIAELVSKMPNSFDHMEEVFSAQKWIQEVIDINSEHYGR